VASVLTVCSLRDPREVGNIRHTLFKSIEIKKKHKAVVWGTYSDGKQEEGVKGVLRRGAGGP